MTIKKDILTINFTLDGMKEVRGLVIHSMWGTYQGSIAWFKNPEAKASTHYLISAEGEITQMVLDKDMAWHAGVIDDVAPDWVLPNPNWYCIGIELEDKRDANWQYPMAQREATAWLIDKLRKQYKISTEKILLHRQLNPSRRSDPVGNFSYEWALKLQYDTDSEDMKRAMDLLEDFKVKEEHGNYEGAMRALIGRYYDLEAMQSDIESIKKDLEQRIKSAVEQAISENTEEWQSKLDIANDKIKELERTISGDNEKKLVDFHWTVLFGQALKNWWKERRGGDSNA